jgi:RNA polymerase sigma-70 factor (ECF subfamily)
LNCLYSIHQQEICNSLEIHSNEGYCSNEGFEALFKAHYKALYAYACTILRDEDQADDTVQNVFFKLWQKKEDLAHIQSVKAYLYRSVYNESMNYIKRQQLKTAHQEYSRQSGSHTEALAGHKLIGKELEQKIAAALRLLPEQCRTIFQMSRFQDLKYKEIAEHLNISVKTVENQMGKALKIMRTQLADYLPIFLLIILACSNEI